MVVKRHRAPWSNRQKFPGFSNKNFAQIIVIPMDSDSASFFANMLLFYHKDRWIKKVKIYDIRGALRPVNLFSFIDYLAPSMQCYWRNWVDFLRYLSS